MKTQSKQVTDQQHDSANTNLISSGAGGGFGGGVREMEAVHDIRRLIAQRSEDI